MRRVGTNRVTIRREVERLLTDSELYAMASVANPYGHCKACNEIADIIEAWAVDGFSFSSPRRSWSAASNVA